MRVLIGCEFTGTTREAFKEMGHDAWSCDLLPTEQPGQHYQCDVRELFSQHWDLAIFHPPCKYLSSAGAWTQLEQYLNRFPDHRQKRKEAIQFFLDCINAPIKRICVENPAGCMSKIHRAPSQVIHPFYFGDPHLKRTCLWLKNLPRLNGLHEVAAAIDDYRPEPRYIDKSGKNRYYTDSNKGWKKRSRSFNSISQAMAMQWNFSP